MKHYVLLTYFSENDLRKLIIKDNKISEYKKYLTEKEKEKEKEKEDSKENLIDFISNNLELTYFHKLVQELGTDDTTIEDNWLDENYCTII